MDISVIHFFLRFNFPRLFFYMNTIYMLFKSAWQLELLVTDLSFSWLCFFFNMRIISMQVKSTNKLEVLSTVLSFCVLLYMNISTLSVLYESTWHLEILVTILSYCRLWWFLFCWLIDWCMYIAVQFEFWYSPEIFVIAFRSYRRIWLLLPLCIVYLLFAWNFGNSLILLN